MIVAEMLLATKITLLDTVTEVSYLTIIERELDQSDWIKIVHLFKYVRGTKDLPFIVIADNRGMLKWYIYGLHEVQPNMRGRTGGGLKMRQGFPISVLSKQKLDTRSSTKL